MTFGKAATTTNPRPVRSRSRRRVTTIAYALAAVLTLPAGAEAALVTFGFETLTATGDPFGVGLFTIDDDDFPFPFNVRSGWNSYPPGPDVLHDFFYIDPHVGLLDLSKVASVHFEIALDPFTHLVDDVNSKWAFIIADVGNVHVLQGDVSGLGPLGVNTFSRVLNGLGQYDDVLLAASFPQIVPEPTSLLLFGSAVTWLVRRRRFARR